MMGHPFNYDKIILEALINHQITRKKRDLIYHTYHQLYHNVNPFFTLAFSSPEFIKLLFSDNVTYADNLKY